MIGDDQVKKVLLVEDTLSLAHVYMGYLREAGYEVTHVDFTQACSETSHGGSAAWRDTDVVGRIERGAI